MKTRVLFFTVLVSIAGVFTGCVKENKALKQEAVEIADIMCKSVEAMQVLQSTDPADSVKIHRAQSDYRKIQEEMATLYRNFHTKHGNQNDDKAFNNEFRKYLNEAMLGCKHLSEKDRAVFEKKVED